MQKKIVKPLIKKSAEFNWLLGLLFVALGTAICEKANLGISMIAAPAFIIHEAVSKVTDVLAVGHIEYMVQFVILLLTCAICKKFDWKYIFSFLTAVIYGLILNMWMAIFSNVTFNELWLRWIMFFVGNTCVCIGVALFFRTYMPHEAYELIVTEITKTYKFKATNVKWVYDIASLVVSLILALSLFGDVTTFEWGKIYEQSFHFIGLGTIIAAFISAPIINLFGKLFEYIFGTEPLIKPLHKFLESSKKKKEEKPVASTTAVTKNGEEITLYVPDLDELESRKQMESDPATMSYNAGYNLDCDGYNNETGCMEFDEDEWVDWYDYFVDSEPERYFAYIQRVADGKFLGEVNFHYVPEKDWWDMGIVISAQYRGMGYSAPALKLLIEHAFINCGVSKLHNDFEKSRDSAYKVFISAGFKEIGENDGIVEIMYTKDDFFKNYQSTNAQTNSANEVDVTIGPAETALTPEMAEEENSTNNEETPDSVEE